MSGIGTRRYYNYKDNVFSSKSINTIFLNAYKVFFEVSTNGEYRNELSFRRKEKKCLSHSYSTRPIHTDRYFWYRIRC